MQRLRYQLPFRASLLGLLFCLLGSATALATAPRINTIQPKGGTRGTELDVRIPGARLADVQEILFHEPGIEVKQLEPEEAKGVKARLAIAADCPPGIKGLRVRTASGISNLVTFHVGPLPAVAEKEPNSEFDAPQPIDLNVTVSGVVQSEDVDYFVVEAKKGQPITAEIEGLRLGRTFFDPYIAILDTERFELARSDDAPLLHQDGVCSIAAPEDGRYLIQVRESAFGGDGNCEYRLHVGTFPRPRAVYPAGGRPGSKLQVRWLGDALGERTEEVTLPAEASADFRLFAQNERGIAPSGNVFRLGDLENILETEPNNERGAANSFAAPAALNGILAEPGDVDHFAFEAKKDQQYEVRVHARSIRSPVDSLLVIRKKDGSAVGNNDDNGGPDSYLRFKAPADDQYILEIRDHLKAGGPEYVYRVEVTPITPKLTMTLPERSRYVATTVEVPRGNRTAVLVGASRADFGGELALDLRGLPAGIAVETVPMAANRTNIPVLLTAAADAEPAGALVDVVGRTTDEKLKLEGHLRQQNWLVRGQNNREVWSYYGDRMGVALTSEAPFSIEVVQPKVPLVRSGSMQLKVVAKRAEGFTGAIAVRLLYNPPGVSSSGSISIPADKTEATIPLTANGSAAIGPWKLLVTGRSSVEGGNVLVSSQFIELQVAEPYLAFKFEKGAVEQGKEVDVLIHVEKKQDFEGSARIELVGLPPGASAEPREINKETKELVFKVKAAADARVGRHKSLVCVAVITENGEPIHHSLGGGELRIDKPLPPKPAKAAKPKPQAAPKPEQVAKKPAAKPLSRLEQLRLERQKAGN